MLRTQSRIFDRYAARLTRLGLCPRFGSEAPLRELVLPSEYRTGFGRSSKPAARLGRRNDSGTVELRVGSFRLTTYAPGKLTLP